MTRARWLCGLGILMALAACTTSPTPYQAATGTLGYRDQQLESNRYRVSFAGNSATPRDKVQDYALYRAAELTIASGNDYFKVASRNTDATSTGGGGPSFGVGVGGVSGGGGGGVGLGLSSILGGGGSSDSYTVSMDILVFKGTKPVNDTEAYDAREVVRRLGPTIQPPPA
jgi:hypothetical protein